MFCLTLHIQMSLSVCSVVCYTHMCRRVYVLSHVAYPDVAECMFCRMLYTLVSPSVCPVSRCTHVSPSVCTVSRCTHVSPSVCTVLCCTHMCRRVYVLSHTVHTCRRVCQKWRVNLCITLRDIRMGGRDILVEFTYLVGIRMLDGSCRGLLGSLLLLCLCLFSTV